MPLFDNFVNPSLPHQLKIMYHNGTNLRATCNCKKWEKIFHGDEPGILQVTLNEYQQHLPGETDGKPKVD